MRGKGLGQTSGPFALSECDTHCLRRDDGPVLCPYLSILVASQTTNW